MITNNKRNWLTALAALSLAACSADVLKPGTEVGQLELPLVSNSANGTQFMLEATFDLTGPETLQAVADPAAPNWSEDVLVLSPRVGNYQLAISNWRIWQLTVDPTNMNVSSSPVMTATLLSSALQQVSIANNTTTSVVYQFAVPGSGVINFARGTLNIDFTVQQGSPDGSACADDLECQSLICISGTCNTASCSDGVQNGGETTPDCGGGCPCGPQTCAVCPPGSQCMTLADGSVYCQGSPCDATQAAICPNPMQCFIEVNGMVNCGAVSTACDAAQAQACGANASCIVDPNGMVICGAVGCNPQDPAACPAGLSCLPDAAGNLNCITPPPTGVLGSLCDPQQVTSCNAGLVCLINNGMYTCSNPPADPNLACMKINEVQMTGMNGASDEFVELYNSCPVNVDLLGARLVYRGANSTSDNPQRTFSTSLIVAGGGYLVLGSPTSSTLHIETLSGGIAILAGGLALRHPDQTVLDSVAWGTVSATHAFIEGTVALAVANGLTLSRIPNGTDTNNNGVDFQERSSSGNSANF